jgi:hypothetical protein
VYCTRMISPVVAGVLVAILISPLTAGAQVTSPDRDAPPLELRRARETTLRRPIAHPAPQRDEAVGEAERAAAEYERTQRGEALMREPSRPAARPDLGYDVYSGIQQRNMQRR